MDTSRVDGVIPSLNDVTPRSHIQVPSVFCTTFFWQPSLAQASYQSFSERTKLSVAATPM